MIDMLAKRFLNGIEFVPATVILIFSLLATAVLANPVGPGEDDDDIPTYTEKVVPGKPTQVPKFGSKKISTSPRKVPEKLQSENKRPYAPPVHTTLGPKATLKTTKAIRGSIRPIRRTNKVSRNPITAYNDLKPSGDYDAPAPAFVRSSELGVEYAPEVVVPQSHRSEDRAVLQSHSSEDLAVPQNHRSEDYVVPQSHRSEALVDDYEPRRVQRHRTRSAPVPADFGSAVGNAPELRYAVAPQRFVSAAAQVKDIPDNGYAGNAYDEKPQPYIFGYELKDENGSTQSRKEQGDDYGNKRGSYGYTDGYGIYRHVDYVADAHGFRAVVKTNEPGTENQDPADVEMHSEAEKY